MKIKAKVIWLVLMATLIYIPIMLLIVNSFNEAKYGITWQGFTLKWYKQLFNHQSLISAALNSVSLGFISASLTSILGIIIAFTLHRYNFRAKKTLKFLILIVLNSPDLIMAISFLILFIFLKINLGFTSLLISHTTFCLPYVVIVIYSRINEFDQIIIDAARDLGASEKDILRKILIPIALPSIVSGWIISFTLSIDDVIVSSFISGPSYEILPVKIYSMLKTGLSPEINALTAIMMLISSLIMIIAHTTSSSIKIKQQV